MQYVNEGLCLASFMFNLFKKALLAMKALKGKTNVNYGTLKRWLCGEKNKLDKSQLFPGKKIFFIR